MTRMKNKKQKPQTLTPEQLAEERDLIQFCNDAALRAFQMLDREEAEAGLPDPYSPSPRTTQPRQIKKKSVQSVQSVVKRKGVEK
jgi:hypothetical protein